MKFHNVGQAVWFEISTGILLWALGLTLFLTGFDFGGPSFLPGALFVAFACLFLSQALFQVRLLRIGLIGITGAGLLFAAIPAVVAKDIVAILLIVTWLIGLLIADVAVSEGIGIDPEKGDASLPDFSALILAVATFIIGTAFAGAGIWKEWFHLHVNHLLFGNALSLLTSLLFVLAGAGLFIAESRAWKRSRRIALRLLVASLMISLGISYLASNNTPLAVLFFATALLGSLGGLVRKFHIIPHGISDASFEHRNVIGYEYAGRLAAWLVIAWVGISFMLGLHTGLMGFVAAGVAGITSILFHNLAPVEGYTPRSYLASLLAFAGAFIILWSATGALESPFIYLSFVFIIASAVVVNPFWTIPLGITLWLVPATDFFFSTTTPGEKISNFAYYTVTLLIISTYAYLIGKKGNKNATELASLETAARKALENERNISKKLEEKKVNVEEANRELVEMRSALLNVLEDVEKNNLQLEDEHARQDAIFSSVGEGLIAADFNGNIILVNRMARKILGLHEENIIGKPIASVMQFYQGDSEILDTSIFDTSLVGNVQPFKDNLLLLSRSGTRIPVAGSAARFIESGKQVHGIVVAFRDVTREREADQERSSFISVASHQLRTPINAIRWYVDLLIGGDAGKISQQQKEFLTDVSTSVIRIAKLIDDLLQVSRAEEGRLSLQFSSLDPHLIIDSVLAEIEPAVLLRHQIFEKEIPESLPLVYVDQKSIGEVLENLLSNAVKYTPDGGKIVLKVSRDGDFVKFEIIDTGYGMPKTHQHHVFEKFYRGKRAVTMETEGTGLGLYIAKHIIEANGGVIGFDSIEGKGSRFYFTLPLGHKEVTP